MRKFSPWTILIGVLVVLVLWLVFSYNGLVTAKGLVDNRWAQVETQYQRRIDLIQNLVNTVKGAANFEQKTLLALTEARSGWAQSKIVGDRGQQIAAANSFESAFTGLHLTVEAYPQLQAVQAFRDLMAEQAGAENRVSVARKDYNDAVFGYNVRIQRFPGVLAAKIFGFVSEKPFEAIAGSANAPVVDFSK